MKAIRIHEHGGPERLQLEDVERPRPKHGEVLVQIKACALNHLDLWTRRGLPGIKIPLPHVLGSDISGVVAEIGEGLSDPKPGDEVLLQPAVSCRRCARCVEGRDNECREYKLLGYQIDGGYQELIAVPSVNVLPKPRRLSFTEAATVPLVFLTAWHMLVDRARVRPGEEVLVQAAGSGVGTAAIQIAKLWGARVITTASSEAKLERARTLGADETINYREKDFFEEVRRLTGKRGVDVVIEHVGGETFQKSLLTLARGGRLVTCGATADPSIGIDLRHVFAKHLSILGSYMGRKGELIELLPHFDTGRLRPVVDRVFPLEEAAEAHRHMENRSQFGKIVLQFS
jgi:NADPH:quinone reductase-like Zn-dependent oxidoreductase